MISFQWLVFKARHLLVQYSMQQDCVYPEALVQHTERGRFFFSEKFCGDTALPASPEMGVTRPMPGE